MRVTDTDKKEEQQPMTDAQFKAWLMQTGDCELSPFMSTPPLPSAKPKPDE